ncbi:MAG: hypothetical protein WC807_21310 [Hyphomicrobium sp.]|jgi:hypothetical protein
MAKTTRALSGAAKDAYFRRALEQESGIDMPVGARLLDRLQSGVAQVRVRLDAGSGEPGKVESGSAETAPASVSSAQEASLNEAFDPFALNVILVLRTRGRDAVLRELEAIQSASSLRLLAREQQLSIGTELATLAEIRDAIATAAERRVANRKAAAG